MELHREKWSESEPESPRSNETHNGEPPTTRQSVLSNGQGQSFKQRSLYPHWYWVAPGHPPIGPRASRPSNGVQHSLGRLQLFARGRNRESLLSTIRKPKEHQSFQLPGPEANHIVRANALARTRPVVRAQCSNVTTRVGGWDQKIKEHELAKWQARVRCPCSQCCHGLSRGRTKRRRMSLLRADILSRNTA